MFPLYSIIAEKVTENELTKAQKTKLVNEINSLDDDGHSIIYALIKNHYSVQENFDKNKKNKPYDCVFTDKNVQIDINMLPNKLQQIMKEFTKKHLRKMKDDSMLDDARTSMGE